jgi:hypothetical protein
VIVITAFLPGKFLLGNSHEYAFHRIEIAGSPDTIASMPSNAANLLDCCVQGCTERVTYSVSLVHGDGVKDEVAACAIHMHKALDAIKLPLKPDGLTAPAPAHPGNARRA